MQSWAATANQCGGPRLLQVFTHLQETFGHEGAISAYQHAVQKGFLAIS